ncbi:mannosyl-oligosaccharide 1,2-alpha-mannosidase IB [Powellomyces hirtus]|nr:mannosyl-oligosaccharide 1,2-alpha-mannosidase IB [Powellomyces hirtus]
MPRFKQVWYAALVLLSFFFITSFLSKPSQPSPPPSEAASRKEGAAGPEGSFAHGPVGQPGPSPEEPKLKSEPKHDDKSPPLRPERPVPKPEKMREKSKPEVVHAYPFPSFLGTDRGVADEKMMTTVKEMMMHAWDAYVEFAPLADELRPVSRTPHNWYSSNTLLSTPIDALDTLYIMGLKSRYDKAKDMVVEHLRLDIDYPVSLFETNIRVLGGLLSAWEFDHDKRFMKLAEDLAERMTHAFNTPTGLPINSFNLKLKTAHSNGGAGLAEMGTLQLELQYLSDVTGKSIYAEKASEMGSNALKVFDTLYGATLPIPGLYPTHWSTQEIPVRKDPGNEHYSVGAEADSYYEYLLKLWLSTGDVKYRAMYDLSAEAIRTNMVQIDGERAYIPDATHSANGFSRQPHFHHLSCFAGGMFATGALSQRHGKWTSFLDIGRKITETCWESYAKTATGLGPEEIFIDKLTGKDSRYLLRPETIESIFYMWRFTHDPIYRDMGRSFVDSLQKYCKQTKGYAGVHNVFSKSAAPDDLQQSFFLAETLKYAYLLFTDDDTIPLEAYVFNTEAHPVSMRGWGQRQNIPRGDVNLESTVEKPSAPASKEREH